MEAIGKDKSADRGGGPPVNRILETDKQVHYMDQSRLKCIAPAGHPLFRYG